MGGTALRLGPFSGGLNNESDQSSIADNELFVCDNMEFDVDGALISRPPIVSLLNAPVASQTMDLLGYYIDSSGTNWLLGSQDTSIYYYTPSGWIQIVTGFRASAMVQYLNKAFIVAEPGSAANGGSWVPTTVGAAGTFTPIATMPKGMGATTFKERMYVVAGSKATANESRLYFSNLSDPTVWSPSDFVDINPGDGQKLIDLYVLNSNVYLFKNDSTYVFTYDAAPTKGTVQNISKVVGISGTGCVGQYENVLYVYHEDFVYELINYNFSKLNVKVNFEPNFALSLNYFRSNFISVLGDRLVVRYFDKIYIFNFRTRTWSTWSTTLNFGRFFTEPRASNTTAYPRYVSGGAITGDIGTFILQDGFDTINSENMTCTIVTKIFDFSSPQQFKKMYWWGVDVLATGIVTGTVTPIIFTFSVTWAQLAVNTWATQGMFTWDQPSTAVPVISDSTNTAGSKSRKFIKFLKAIRFRNIFFTVTLTTTGTSVTGPVKLFTVNPVINMRQAVNKEIN